MGWPCRLELWGETIDQAREDYAAVANAIAAFEPVTMIAEPGEDAAAARAARGRVEIVELPLDDSWLRDCGPIYVYGEGRRRRRPLPLQRLGGEVLALGPGCRGRGADRRAAGRRRAPGAAGARGGIDPDRRRGHAADHRGVSAQPEPQPVLSRTEIEQELARHLGVERIVWLGRGLVEDRDTDGHVDLIAAFAAAGSTCSFRPCRPSNPNVEHCRRTASRLRGGRHRGARAALPALRGGGRRDGRGRLSELLSVQRRGDRARVRRGQRRGRARDRSRARIPGGRWCRSPGRCSPTAAAVRTASPSRFRRAMAERPSCSPPGRRPPRRPGRGPPTRPPLRVGLVQQRWHADPDEHEAALARGSRWPRPRGRGWSACRS